MISWAKPGILSSEHRIYPFIVLSNILTMTFLAILSAVATIMSDDCIQGELALSGPLAIWLTTLYLLGVNTTVPASSWFADRFGNKTMYIFGVGLFTLSSALAAVSFNFPMLALARFLEGIGAGFIFPVGLASIVRTLPRKMLPLALALYMATCFGAGFAIGLPFAGYLAQFHSWRWIFGFMVPVGIIGVVLCWLIHEESEKKETPPFDLWGFFFFALFIASLLIALTYGPLSSTNEGWRNPYIVLLFGIAALSLMATIAIERSQKAPIFPLTLFKNPLFCVASIAMFLLGMSIFASVSTMMQYAIDALLYEKYVSGKIGIVYGLALATCSILANVIIKKIPVSLLTFIGLAILIYSYSLNNELNWMTGPDQIFWILLIRGIGIGLSLGPTTMQALQNVPPELANQAATLISFFRQVGGTYGGTLIAIVTIKRKIFHAARFGEQANAQLPGYKVTFRKLFQQFYNTSQDGVQGSAHQAAGAIIQNIETQSFIQAINDAMIVLAYVTAVVALFLLCFSFRNWWKERQKITL